MDADTAIIDKRHKTRRLLGLDSLNHLLLVARDDECALPAVLGRNGTEDNGLGFPAPISWKVVQVSHLAPLGL